MSGLGIGRQQSDAKGSIHRAGGNVKGRWISGGRARLVGAVLLAALALSGCVTNAPQTALKPQGTQAQKTQNLFVPVFYIAVVVFIIVEGLVVYCVVRFRARSEDDAPVQIHGSRSLET